MNEKNVKKPLADIPQEKRQRCEVWTRVMGYHRPVSGWNAGKQSEHRERKYFVESRCACKLPAN